MSNYEKYEFNYSPADLNDTNSTTKNINISYVASVNSDKFHEPSCSQAKKIKEKNKVTFSSRDEAIKLGYSPCGYCYP